MTAPAPHRPLSVRAINRAGAGLRRLGLPLFPLREELLLRTARKATGLEDFGGEGFREGLRRLLESLNGEARLNFLGRVAATAQLRDNLITRLRVRDHRKRHPGVAEQEIRKPLFILGLPRTGTTVLFNLLAQDPGTRAPLSWEVQYPCPPPRADGSGADSRIEKTQQQFANLSRVAPGLEAIHEFGAELPQECVAITGHEFMSVQFHILFNVPGYQEWLDRQRFVPALQYHRRFLQHLQSERSGERWVLKSPGHLAVLADLLEVYPDARIVHTHRDPVAAMPSLASLSCSLRGIGSDAVDPRFVGRQQVELWEAHLRRAMRARDRSRDRAQQFFDVQCEDVARSPIEVIERIYAHFDIPFRDEARERMRAFLAANPRGQHGPHRYCLEDFGLDHATERARFADYCERFEIPTRADPGRG
ncbi:MAG: sulfotransferase [Myxococcales bacterium]|nr:sulfotransferase [Myxococcales bacterium]